MVNQLKCRISTHYSYFALLYDQIVFNFILWSKNKHQWSLQCLIELKTISMSGNNCRKLGRHCCLLQHSSKWGFADYIKQKPLELTKKDKVINWVLVISFAYKRGFLVGTQDCKNSVGEKYPNLKQAWCPNLWPTQCFFWGLLLWQPQL